ncbi:MAG: 3-isopropylmalate dehydratase large subunit [Candidatus Rokubacteria bacterium]|nr:3-isopropylmalate dehydratase large subunit [Candidatus Rokubacteria bacterium]
MGMTIAEKILARASGREGVSPGEIVVVKVDTAVVIDMGFYPGLWRWPTRVWDPEKVVVIHDHVVPPKDVQSAQALQTGRRFVREYGIARFHDVGPSQGIAHQVAADEAYARPGTVLVCIDSHTCSGGALNCCARGIGAPELTYVLAKGETWFQVGPTVKYELHGTLAPWVTAKDVFFHIAGRWGSHATLNVEFGGPALGSLSLDARRTLSTMCAEVSAEFALWPPDDVLLSHVKSRTTLPFHPTWPDPDARYVEVRRVDLDALGPYVARPDTVVHNTLPIGELSEQVRLDQCFVGSCANGTLDDLATVAAVVRGKQVAPGVRFIVTPGSQRIYREAARLGIVNTLIQAGALVTTSACGACAGLDFGALGPGEVCLTASTRNFKGRMGHPDARIWMGSPATVAASALTGYITDPRAVGGGARA